MPDQTPLTPEGVRALIDDLAVVAASASHHKESRLDTGKCIECSDLWPCFDQRSADTARRAIAALSAPLPPDDGENDLDHILDGIDREDGDRGGWWETSTGAEFGARKLAEVRRLLASRTVETAEEWEYGIQHARATHGRAFTLEEQAAREMVASTTPGRIRLVRRPRLPWEPVPPTPKQPRRIRARELNLDSGQNGVSHRG